MTQGIVFTPLEDSTSSITFTPIEGSDERNVKKRTSPKIKKALSVAAQGGGGALTGFLGQISQALGTRLQSPTALPSPVEGALGGLATNFAPPSVSEISRRAVAAIPGSQEGGPLSESASEEELAAALGLQEPEGYLETIARRGGASTGRALSGGVSGQLSALLGLGGGLGGAVETATGSPVAGGLTELLAGGGLGGLVSKASGLRGSQQQLQKSASRFKATPEEITALTQSPGKVKSLASIKPKGKSFEKTLSGLKDLGTRAIKETEDVAEKLPPLNTKQTLRYLHRVKKLGKQFNKNNINPSEEEEKAVKFFNSTIKKSLQKGVTPANLTQSFRSVNKRINWNSIDKGKYYLRKYKDAIRDTLKEVDPKYSQIFEDSNKVYSAQKNFLKNVKAPEITELADRAAIPVAGVKALMSFLTTLAPLAAAKTFGTSLLAKYVGQRLAGKLLTSPKYNNISRRVADSLKKGKTQQAAKSLRDLYDVLGPESVEDLNEESE